MLCTTFLWKFGAEDVCLHFLYLYVPSSWYIYLPRLFSWVYLPTFLPTTWTNSHSFFQFYLFTCISFVIYLWNTQVKLFLFVLNYKCWKNEWKDSSHGLRYQRQTSNHCATCLGLISYVVANLLFIRLFFWGGASTYRPVLVSRVRISIEHIHALVIRFIDPAFILN